MNRMSRGFLVSVFMLTLVLFLALPTTAFAQRGGRRRGARQERREGRRDEGQLRRTAQTSGYNSGKRAGIKDRKRGEPSDFRDEKDYQQATRGYSSRLGSKELYRQVFQEAYENGYRDGWNGY